MAWEQFVRASKTDRSAGTVRNYVIITTLVFAMRDGLKHRSEYSKVKKGLSLIRDEG